MGSDEVANKPFSELADWHKMRLYCWQSACPGAGMSLFNRALSGHIFLLSESFNLWQSLNEKQRRRAVTCVGRTIVYKRFARQSATTVAN